MKRFPIPLIVVVSAMLLGACGSVDREAIPAASAGATVPNDNRGQLVGQVASGVPRPEQFDTQQGVLHRSGGPYVPASEAESTAAGLLGCAGPVAPQASAFKGGACAGVTTVFYDSAASAYAAHPDWGVASVGTDRELYFVTIHGQVKFFPKTMAAAGADGVTVDHMNVAIDATTGEVVGSGTAGTPLS